MLVNSLGRSYGCKVMHINSNSELHMLSLIAKLRYNLYFMSTPSPPLILPEFLSVSKDTKTLYLYKVIYHIIAKPCFHENQ